MHGMLYSRLPLGSVTFYSGHPARHIRSGSQRMLKILRLWLRFDIPSHCSFLLILRRDDGFCLWPFSKSLTFWGLSSCLSSQIPWIYIQVKHFGLLEVIWPCVVFRLLTLQTSQKLPEGRMLIKYLCINHCNYHVSCLIWQSHSISYFTDSWGKNASGKQQKEGKLILILVRECSPPWWGSLGSRTRSSWSHRLFSQEAESDGCSHLVHCLPFVQSGTLSLCNCLNLAPDWCRRPLTDIPRGLSLQWLYPIMPAINTTTATDKKNF